MSRARYESVDRVCARWQHRYRRKGLGGMKHRKPPPRKERAR